MFGKRKFKTNAEADRIIKQILKDARRKSKKRRPFFRLLGRSV